MSGRENGQTVRKILRKVTKAEAAGHKEKFPEAESGRAKDKAAEKVNADVSGRENDSAVAHGRGEPVWQKPLLPNRETPTNSPFEPLRDNYCYSRRV